ncbi:MAG: hypothetical protein GY757_14645, partial [bacterium]|nr:hypothetical protein [bacterium]
SPVHLETNEPGELKVTLQEKTVAETAAAAGKQKGAAGDDKYMLNGDREITCTIQQEDGSVISGVWVEIIRRFSDGSSVIVDIVVSNEFGNVVFSRLPSGNYIVAPQVYGNGLRKICKEVELLTTDVTTTVQMEYTGWDLELESVARVPFPIDDENRITGPLFVVDKEAETRNAGIVAIVAAPVPIVDEEWHPEKTTWKRGGLANLLRKNYRDLLFFKTLETDETGTVEITVTKPEPLSTYRIKAIAYTEDAFGRAEIKYR